MLADALRITPREASLRIHEAADLASKGEPEPPGLAAVAAAQRDGIIGREHVRVVRSLMHELPDSVDSDTRAAVEAQLVDCAESMRPDELHKVAQRIGFCLNPDGKCSDVDRARRRSFVLHAQGADLMSTGTFCLDPQARAYLEPILAKLAAPGMCHPDDDIPTVDGVPTEEAQRRDRRTRGQRQHDAIKALCRLGLTSGDLGRHRGVPVTVIATTTVGALEQAAGTAMTGGGSVLPMSSLIGMAANARHYLAIFDDNARPLYLARSRRTASVDQRIVLHAKDRGCTFPGCDVPAYLCEAHHVVEWAEGGATNIDNLTLVCRSHHALIGKGKWHTTKNNLGRTEYRPPHHVDPDRQARINQFHHPEDTLAAGP